MEINFLQSTEKNTCNEMLEFQAHKLRCYQIAIGLNTASYNKFYDLAQLTGVQRLSERLQGLSTTIIIIMQAVKAFPNLCQHILNRFTVKIVLLF